MGERVEISKRLVLINSASSLATRLLSISVLVWLQQYLLSRISPEEYSLLPILYAIMMFAPLATTILTGGIGRYIVEAYARDDDDRVTQIVSTMVPILCIAGLLFVAGGWTFAWYIDKVLTIAPEHVWDARVMMALLMFSTAIRLPLSPFGVGLYVRQKFVLTNVISVGVEVLRLALLFTLLFGVSTRVLWVITASVCADLLNLLIVQVLSRRFVPALRFRLSSIHWPIARELTSFGGWNFLLELAGTIRTNADVIILNKLATPLDVANFHLGSLVMKHVQATAITIRSPLQPSLVALYATGDRDRLASIYLKGNRYGLWGIQLVAFPLIIFSEEIITLYVGSKFSDAATVMALLLATLPIAYANMLMPALANATGQIKPLAIRALILHATNLLLTLYLVGQLEMGAVGSALATLVSTLFYVPLLYWPLGIKLSGVGWRVWFVRSIAPGVIPGLAGAAVWVFCRPAAPPESWLKLGLYTAPGLGAYFLVLILFCLQEEDRRYAAAMWNRLLQRPLPK